MGSVADNFGEEVASFTDAGLESLFKGAFERVFNVASFTGTTFIIFFARRLQD